MITVEEIAKLVGGTVYGDGNIRIKDMVSPSFAKEGDMTFAFDDEDFKRAGKTEASCVLAVTNGKNYPKTILQVDDIKLAMTVIYNEMIKLRIHGKGAIHPTAIIDDTAKLGKDVLVGPNVVIGGSTKIGDNVFIGANCVIGKNVTIGEKTYLFPNITVYDCSEIGKNVTIHSGTVIGADGFGYIPKDGKIYKVPQMGKVIIEDDVEIGANVCIDRGTFDTTVIGEGAKIDNLVQIAHNIKIGKNVIIAAQTGIAGSTSIGENTMMGGMVGIADHIKIGKNVKIGGKTGVTGHIRDNEVIFGYPHRTAESARMLHALQGLLLKHSRKFRKFLRTLPDEPE